MTMTEQLPPPTEAAEASGFPPPALAAAAIYLDLGQDPDALVVVADQGRASEPGRVVLRVASPAPPAGGGVRLSIAGSPSVLLALVERAQEAVFPVADRLWDAEVLGRPNPDPAPLRLPEPEGGSGGE